MQWTIVGVVKILVVDTHSHPPVFHAGYSDAVAKLRRTLGPWGSAGIGGASMVGAGAFYVWSPAASLAGPFLLISLALAGVVALLNAITMAQLALQHPVSGGVYHYARRYVSPRAGFLAGWMFMLGKTASAAAIALIAAQYLAPDHTRLLAALLIAVFAAANLTGLRTTARISIGLVSIVVVVLVALMVQSPWRMPELGVPSEVSVYGVAQSAGLIFFAFAGYARMATLGEEVKNPRVVLPRVIVGTLGAVLVLYVLLALALLGSVGVEGLAASATPVADMAPDSWRLMVVAVASLASLGSLAAIFAGLSRTSMAMAQEGDLPSFLGLVWARTSSPARAEITMALAAMTLALLVDPLWLVALSSSAVLSYYAIAHLCALAQPAHERLAPRLVAWTGLVLALALVAALPWQSLVVGALCLALGVMVFARVQTYHSRGQIDEEP